MTTQTNLYEDIVEQKAGDIVKETITEVVRGTAQDLMPEGMLENSQYPIDPQSECVEVSVNAHSEYFNIPKDKPLTPRHKLARFKRTYGKFPEVGLEVSLQTDGDGFKHIVLQ